MPEKEIPRNEWKAFCASFAGLHRHWLVRIEIIDDEGVRKPIAEDAPLESIQLGREGNIDISVRPRPGSGKILTHTIGRPDRLVVQETDDGTHEGFLVYSREESTTTLRLRVPAHPETVDGIA